MQKKVLLLLLSVLVSSSALLYSGTVTIEDLPEEGEGSSSVPSAAPPNNAHQQDPVIHLLPIQNDGPQTRNYELSPEAIAVASFLLNQKNKGGPEPTITDMFSSPQSFFIVGSTLTMSGIAQGYQRGIADVSGQLAAGGCLLLLSGIISGGKYIYNYTMDNTGYYEQQALLTQEELKNAHQEISLVTTWGTLSKEEEAQMKAAADFLQGKHQQNLTTLSLKKKEECIKRAQKYGYSPTSFVPKVEPTKIPSGSPTNNSDDDEFPIPNRQSTIKEVEERFAGA